MKITEIISKYTEGMATLEETNAALAEISAGLHLESGKNALTEDEIEETTAETAATASGWGLLDTGTGTLDKVEVRDGELVDTDCGEMYALCLIGGKTYRVHGTALAEPEAAE